MAKAFRGVIYIGAPLVGCAAGRASAYNGRHAVPPAHDAHARLGLLAPDPDGLKRVAVVGNGPLSAADRAAINNQTNVVRFNDYVDKNYVHGDKITIHCATTDHFRNPWANSNATKWAVAQQLRHLDADSKFYTWNMNPSQVRVYGTKFFWSVALGLEPASVLAPWFDTYRLFSGCARRRPLLNKNTESGYSRAGAQRARGRRRRGAH